MYLSTALVFSTNLVPLVLGRPAVLERQLNPLTNSTDGPIPDESPIYNNYTGTAAPFPGNETAFVPATESGPPGPDDVLFQNLLSAEWIIYSFYQQAVEALNQSVFTELGLPNTTYQRVAEIRDNEAGHLRIFQDSISPTSSKPGACQYDFGWTSAGEWLALQNLIEISSMAFLTGLAQTAKMQSTIGALVAIAQVETRHETWGLIDIWNTDPFAGPSDTVFPYANEILYTTLVDFIVNGSCPSENPEYPYPSQKLPQLSYNSTTSSGHPGSPVEFIFQGGVPTFVAGQEYYAVFNHGVANITMPFDTATNMSQIPKEFDSDKGIIIATITDAMGAPTLENVLAGPLILLQQPGTLTAAAGTAQ